MFIVCNASIPEPSDTPPLVAAQRNFQVVRVWIDPRTPVPKSCSWTLHSLSTSPAIPTTRPPLGRRVHLLAAVRGVNGCTKASAGHAPVFARVLVSLPRMGQCYSQGFGCGHLPVSSTHGCAAAALPLTKPIEVASTGVY